MGQVPGCLCKGDQCHDDGHCCQATDREDSNFGSPLGSSDFRRVGFLSITDLIWRTPQVFYENAGPSQIPVRRKLDYTELELDKLVDLSDDDGFDTRPAGSDVGTSREDTAASMGSGSYDSASTATFSNFGQQSTVTEEKLPLAVRMGLQTPPQPSLSDSSEAKPDRPEVSLVRSLSEEFAAAPSYQLVCGFVVRDELLPANMRSADLGSYVEEVRAQLGRSEEMRTATEESQRIIRYLLGTSFDVRRTVELLEARRLWQKANRTSCIQDSLAQGLRIDEFPYYAEFARCVSFHPFFTRSPEGHPIAIYRVDCSRLAALRHMDQARALELFRYVNEYVDAYLFRRSEETHRLLGTITIIRVQGLRLSRVLKAHSAVKRVLRPIFADSTKFYMEDGYHTFFLDVPKLLIPLWRMAASLWLSKRALAKMTIAKQAPDSLLALIEEDTLPMLMEGLASNAAMPPARDLGTL
eukprot:gnl/TRDRNA2_/TRDRNA2_184501_c0_seq1.p1 gnl/TRDRNA2_/TRDRNA2_184501_c0~~gnl/TRDRNA2_/TRDRNA2_184501_c0_seq1.p1  ORF type:complete len:505 (+),score=73.92 gnl/TRDRNA2_/TRDRNA2_184501_c0_seq1:114-1517(+)